MLHPGRSKEIVQQATVTRIARFMFANLCVAVAAAGDGQNSEKFAN